MTGIVNVLSQARGRPLSCIEDLHLRLAARRTPTRMATSQALAASADTLSDAIAAEVLKAYPPDTPADDLSAERTRLLEEVGGLLWAFATAVREGSSEPTLLRALRDHMDLPDTGLSAPRRAELCLLALHRLAPEHAPPGVAQAIEGFVGEALALIQQAADARWLQSKHRWLADAAMRRILGGMPDVATRYGEAPTLAKGKRDAEYLLEELAGFLRSSVTPTSAFAAYLAREVFPFTDYSPAVYRMYLLALAESVAVAGEGVAGRRAAEVFESLVDRIDAVMDATDLNRHLDSIQRSASGSVKDLGSAGQRGLRLLLDGIADLIACDQDQDAEAVAALWCESVCPQLPFVRPKQQGALLKACMLAGQRELKGALLKRFLQTLNAISGVARRLSWVAQWFGVRDDVIGSSSQSLRGVDLALATAVCASLLDEALLGLPGEVGSLKSAALLEIALRGLEPAVIETAASALAAEVVRRGGHGATQIAACLGSLSSLQADLLLAHAVRSCAIEAAKSATQAGIEHEPRFDNPVAIAKGERDLAAVVHACAEAVLRGQSESLLAFYEHNVLSQLNPGTSAQSTAATIRTLANQVPGVGAAFLSDLADRVPALVAADHIWRHAGSLGEKSAEAVLKALPDYAEKVGEAGLSKAKQDLATGLRCVARALHAGESPEAAQAKMQVRVLGYLRTPDPKLVETLHSQLADTARTHLDPLSFAAAEPHLTTLYDSLNLEEALCPAP